jgi:hypothetical protein
MGELWGRVAPERNFATVHDGRSVAAWIDAAPGLEPSSYLLARRRDGGLAGFIGLWDQESFKQTRITGYAAKLAVVRRLFNAAAPRFGAPRLPPAGGALRHVTVVHVCVPASTPGVLRSLVVHAHNELRGGAYSFLAIGLDVRDPLAAAVSGLLAQPTDIWACVAMPRGADLTDRPVHHEIALA